MNNDQAHYDADLRKLHREFTRYTARGGKKAIKEWINKHPELSPVEISSITNLSVGYIKAIRNNWKIGITRNKRKYSSANIIVPEDWYENKLWFWCVIKIYSINTIAATIGVSNDRVRSVANRLGVTIPRKAVARADKNLVFKMVSTDGMPIHKCARLLGVSPHAVYTALAGCRSKPHTKPVKIVKNHPSLWIGPFIDNLRSQDVVASMAYFDDYIYVRYKDGCHEKYFPFKYRTTKPNVYSIDEYGARIRDIPEVEFEFDDIGGDYSAHIIIDRGALNRASIIEQRIALHRFAGYIINHGLGDLSIPQREIDDDMNSISAKQIIDTNVLTMFDSGCGTRISLGFFGHETNILNNTKTIVMALNKLLTKSYKFNTVGMLRMATQMEKNRIPDADGYMTLFELAEIDGAILDLAPGLGVKAIAAAKCGIKYMHTSDERFDKAVSAGFAEAIGLDICSNSREIDAIIHDNNLLRPVPLNEIDKLIGRTNKLIVYVDKSNYDEVIDKYKPARILRIGYSTGERKRCLLIFANG